MYKIPDKTLWNGRVDLHAAEGDLRWHQVVQMLHLDAPIKAPKTAIGIVFVGFCCDAGVKRNKGRVGAAEGAEAIRKSLANLPIHFDQKRITLYDGGDVLCEGAKMESAQEALAEKVRALLAAGYKPIVLGGGHEVAFGHFLGIDQYATPLGKSVGIINIDAHFDLRNYDLEGNSGTPFLQIAQYLAEKAVKFYYQVYGVDEASNTKSLFATARSLGVEWTTNEQLEKKDWNSIREQIYRFCQSVDLVYLTLDMDVFQAAYAPGVSAPAAYGISPQIVAQLLKEIIAQCRIVSFDLAELNPTYDLDARTAKLAARTIFDFVKLM